MAGLEALISSNDFDPSRDYTAVPDPDAPGCHHIFLGSPNRPKLVGYLESAAGGTVRAYYGTRAGERLGRAETIAGGVNIVTLYHRSKLVGDWCRTWGHLDALHDGAEDLSGWGS